MRKIILGILMVLGLVSISFAASEFKDMGKEGPGIVCPIDFQNMTTEEIQEQLQLRLADLENEYASCEDEQLRTRIQERIEMTQGLIDDPEKLEEMITNMPEEMPERKGNGFKIDFQNMTTEEIQDALEEQLADLENEYASCEDEQLRTRIQERIEMTQSLIDDPEKLEEMITNIPEDMPERKGECQKANFE
ncbi:ferritin-like metal-binding protein YciE [Methanococcus maripaludis]|uniref:Ferritin-like metal-binding protein YciE n=1 Tax=Methanococcus maripaludis TaxID=39152 RepID=A0A7J9P763_METMI|nr:ferritin-like metal-binding protein YciE [Methanococcus maripaludis]